jgi:hypothetical protein
MLPDDWGIGLSAGVEVENAGEFERSNRDILSKLPGVLRIRSSFSIRNVLANRIDRS